MNTQLNAQMNTQQALEMFLVNLDTLIKSKIVPSYKKVIFQNPATIIIWSDGSKTVVKCHDDDVFNPYVGYLLCTFKKILKSRQYTKICEMLHHIYQIKSVKNPDWYCEKVTIYL